MLNSNPAKQRRREPAAATCGAATVRLLGRDSSPRRPDRRSVPPAGPVRGSDRPAPGEWIALEHRDIDREARIVYVRRAFRNGRLKCPKTDGEPPRRSATGDRDRSTRRLTTEHGSPLVFQAPRGGYLDLHNFRHRDWKPAQRAARDRPDPAGLRSPAHLRDVRAACRHLHLRPLPLHGRQPDDDRPPLRPPRQGRPPARDRRCSTLTPHDVHAVDARWTRRRTSHADRGPENSA